MDIEGYQYSWAVVAAAAAYRNISHFLAVHDFAYFRDLFSPENVTLIPLFASGCV